MTKLSTKHTRIYAAFVILAIFFTTNLLVAGFASAQAGAVDTKEPSDVEGVAAIPGDSEVTLTWNSATDDTGVVGYKIYRGTHSVTKTEDRYDLPIIPVGDVQSYTVKNLTNGQTYYFVITAVDGAGNQSVNYSYPEVSGTPQAGLHGASIEDDGKSPQVKNVKAEDNITVLVEFSEPIKLPEEHPASAFQIEKISDKSRLQVQQADISDEDDTGKTVVLTTAPQQDGEDYLLTAGLEIQDMYSNPVESGTSDTGSFEGSGKNKQVAEVKTVSDTPANTDDVAVNETTTEPATIDVDPPVITDAIADYNNRMSITFSEKVVLPSDPTKKIVINKKGSAALLKIVNVSLSVDEKTVYITTDPQEATEYDVQMLGIKDAAGNNITAEGAKTAVTGNTTGIKDTTPPEDVTALTAKIKDRKKNIVELSWKASKNTAGDLNDQLLYQSEGKVGTAYDKGNSLGADPLSAEVQDLKGGKWYTFKVSTKDTSGNESKGAVASVYLPQTGPGMIAAGLTSVAMGWYSRRKKKKLGK